jgi:hypothetical protein
VLPRPEDRRQAQRRYYKTQAICHKGKDGLGDVVTGQLLNLSAAGAQVLVRAGFDENEELYLALVNPRRQTIAELHGAVRWRQPEGPGVLRIGIAFDRLLTDEELSAVV